jgi:hypothetical protein
MWCVNNCAWVVVAFWTLSADAWASAEAGSAPPDGSAPHCSVQLNKLSYDDPGADDSELLELFVAAEPGSEVRALADCNLEQIELFNGADGTREVYRSLDVGQVQVPSRGYVLICASGSEIDLDVQCDITTSSNGALGQSWLQNGPSDGLVFRGSAPVRLASPRRGQLSALPPQQIASCQRITPAAATLICGSRGVKTGNTNCWVWS